MGDIEKLTDKIAELETRLKAAIETNNKQFDIITRMTKEKTKFTDDMQRVFREYNIDLVGWGKDEDLKDLESFAWSARSYVDDIVTTLDTIRTER